VSARAKIQPLDPSAEAISRATASRKLYRTVGQFLDEHDLSPTPDNYTLVYHLFVNGDSPVAQAVKAAISDGVRLSQRHADGIIAEHGIRSSSSPSPHISLQNVLAAAQRQVKDFEEIVETTHAQTRDYGRDLKEQEEQLRALSDDEAVEGLIRITGAMIQRNRSTERKLAAARKETETLKEKLVSVENQARRDTLTGLPNRRAFEDRCAELEMKRGTMSLAICDVDNFKRINDGYGHGVGDRVLRMVAHLLETTCIGHLVARLGGEEFVILFEGIAPAEAAEILEEARATLASKHFRIRETDAPIGMISFSAGIAGGKFGDGEASPLQRADALLYEAKNSGRNQIKFED
jgi:diguanylate cyclase